METKGPTKYKSWRAEYVHFAKMKGFSVTPKALRILEMEVKSKPAALISTPKLLPAIRALVEDASAEANKAGRSRIISADMRKALRKCRVYPFCD